MVDTYLQTIEQAIESCETTTFSWNSNPLKGVEGRMGCCCTLLVRFCLILYINLRSCYPSHSVRFSREPLVFFRGRSIVESMSHVCRYLRPRKAFTRTRMLTQEKAPELSLDNCQNRSLAIELVKTVSSRR